MGSGRRVSEMTTRHPHYRSRPPLPQDFTQFASRGDYIDLTTTHLSDGSGDLVSESRLLFDARTAACVADGVALDGLPGAAGPVRIWPAVQWIEPSSGPSASPTPGLGPTPGQPHIDGPWFPTWPFAWGRDLLELKFYGDPAPTIYCPTTKALSALAYRDFFPARTRVGRGLWSMVSAAILASSPGWCGTFGPGVDGAIDVTGSPSEGNYDMTLMHLIPMAYKYFDSLSGDAREYLISMLMQRGRIHRPRLEDRFTSGRAPDDWDRAGYISPAGVHINIGETENHILMIATGRYLTNQLVYQRDRQSDYDNRRNGAADTASCTSIILTLLRNILRDDFSEYNAKPYQSESRHAILNLCTFAYDDEVRLAARMVLDYISARVAVSSDDLRRMVPFRRRNEAPYNNRGGNFMTVPLLEADGADPMGAIYAVQAGNIRGFENYEDNTFSMRESGADLTIEGVSDYRLPASIHDLFVNDLHRRFFQRVHRTDRSNHSDEMGGNRNCDNMEIYAGSPSYLITAGGSPSTWAIDPRVDGVLIGASAQEKQLGVAVTTSFIPTASGHADAGDLLQFGQFGEGPKTGVKNYGVAPDFACGPSWHMPSWAPVGMRPAGFAFFDLRQSFARPDGAGFFLAVFFDGSFALLEAFDTWLHPDIFASLDEFSADVSSRNPNLRLANNEPFTYTTWNRNRVQALIWDLPDTETNGAEVLSITYGNTDPADRVGDAGNVKNRFLNGTVLNNPAEAVVEISNVFLGTKIILDMSDPWNPRRTSESGEVEVAGLGHQVWVDFQWTGPCAGDSCQPFNTVTAAVAAVADGGGIKILPGTASGRSSIRRGPKSFRLEAPFDGVIIGSAVGAPFPPSEYGAIEGTGGTEKTADIRKDSVWVEFDFPSSSAGNVPGPFTTVSSAASAVANHGIVRIVPGSTPDRSTIGIGKPFVLEAPIGRVVIGAKLSV